MSHNHNENMPPWVQRVDSYQNHWHRKKTNKSRNGEYIGAIIFNLFFLWIINKVPDWNLDFIRDNYGVVIWILNVNIMVQIAGNVLMLLTNYAIIRYLARIITESASFVTMMVLFYIYPFDFRNVNGLFWLDWFLPIALIIGMVVSALKVISNLWKLIFWRGRN